MIGDQLHFVFVTVVAVGSVVLFGAAIALAVGLSLRKESGSSKTPGLADPGSDGDRTATGSAVSAVSCKTTATVRHDRGRGR
jgi:hypothetical protein